MKFSVSKKNCVAENKNCNVANKNLNVVKQVDLLHAVLLLIIGLHCLHIFQLSHGMLGWLWLINRKVFSVFTKISMLKFLFNSKKLFAWFITYTLFTYSLWYPMSLLLFSIGFLLKDQLVFSSCLSFRRSFSLRMLKYFKTNLMIFFIDVHSFSGLDLCIKLSEMIAPSTSWSSSLFFSSTASSVLSKLLASALMLVDGMFNFLYYIF